MKLRPIVLLWLALASACGPASEKNNTIIVVNSGPNNVNSVNGTPNATANNQSLSERDQVIVDGFNAPSDAHDAGEGALSLTVEAVVAASVAANGGQQLVTSGTLTQSGQQFSYAAGPNDRLIVKWTEGPQTELFVSQLDGNFEADSVDAFFGADHIVEVRVVREGFADFTVGSSKSGGTRQGTMQGMVADDDGTQYQVNLQETGTTNSSIEITSADYESQSTMSGTITGPNFELVAEETYWFHSVALDNLIVNRSRTANSRWTFNGKEYAVNNVFIRTATKNSYPDEPDYWEASGAITEDGNVVGDVVFDEDQLKVDVLLRLASGETIRLDRYLKAQ